MSLSIGAQTIVWGETIRERYGSVLRFLKHVGYQGVETGMRHFDPADPLTCKELFKGAGLKPLAVHVGGKFWDPDQAEEEIRKIHEAVRFASEVGFSFLVTSGNPQETVETVKKAAETYTQIGEECQRHGLQFAYHNHNWELAGKGRILQELAEGTPKENVSFVLDIAWAYRAKASVETLFELLKGRIAYLHVKDVKEDQFCELGTGEIPIRRIVELARKHRTEWMVVEQDTTTLSPEESMRINFQFLRGLV